MKILQATHLLKRYGGRTVVNDVSFEVEEGEIVGLLGRNGAGKTTSFRCVIGMIQPDGGKIFFGAQDVSRLPMYQRARRGIGYLAQEPSIFTRLNVEQNLMAILQTRSMTRSERKQRAEALMDQFGLTKLRRQAARTLSGGERRKLEIARCLVCEPSMILLDEPFSGVDPVAVEELQEEIRKLREERHIAMLMTDHNVQRTLEIVDRAYVIFEGKVFAHGTPRDIVTDQEVRRLYLGSTFRGDEFDN